MKNSIQLLFAGDFIPPQTLESIYSEALLEILGDKDFSVVNLETSLTNSTKKIIKTGNHFKRPPESIRYVVAGHFDAVALSNNHIRDFGCKGVNETIDVCKRNAVLTMGAGSNIADAVQPLQKTLKGKKISFMNYSEKEFNIASENQAGAAPFDLVEAFYKIQEQKTESDYVIIIYHGGLEYHFYPAPEIIKRFKFLVDAGADCIVSHHTHRFSGMIEYKKKPILFGLGNFLMPTKGKVISSWRIGLVAKVEFKDNDILPVIMPTIMSDDFNLVDVLTGEEKQKVLALINDISRKINDYKSIQGYWNEVYSADSGRIMNIIKSDSLLEYRFRKRFSTIFKPNISEYRLLNILNLMRCDAHKETVIEILDDSYKKRT